MAPGLRIGEVAAKSGFSRKALKVYERRGILPPPHRTPAGYRRYPTDVLPVLAFVAQARRLGLTLSEIRRIVALRCAGPGPCLHVRALLEQKVAAAEKVLGELRRRLDNWEDASRRQGVVCAHIEGRGGDTPWTSALSARPAKAARKSSSKATPSASARSWSRRRRGTA
jgi:MerR family copper efflux transcriptional regulator